MLIRNDPTYGPRLMNCWLPADTWVEALQKTGHIDAALAIDTRKFNATFAKSGSFGSLMSRFDGSNHTGVFHYQHRQYYYFTEEKRQISYPSPLNKAWKERVLEMAENVFSIPSTGQDLLQSQFLPTTRLKPTILVTTPVTNHHQRNAPGLKLLKHLNQ